MVRNLITALRLIVVGGVYFGTSLAGAAVGTAGAPGGAPLGVYLLAALAGGAIVPLALTTGWLLWLVPALLRAAIARDPEPRPTPDRWDAPLLLIPTVAVTLVCSGVVPDTDLGRVVVSVAFGLLAVGSVGAILVTGGRHVALLWLRLVT